MSSLHFNVNVISSKPSRFFSKFNIYLGKLIFITFFNEFNLLIFLTIWLFVSYIYFNTILIYSVFLLKLYLFVVIKLCHINLFDKGMKFYRYQQIYKVIYYHLYSWYIGWFDFFCRKSFSEIIIVNVDTSCYSIKHSIMCQCNRFFVIALKYNRKACFPRIYSLWVMINSLHTGVIGRNSEFSILLIMF